MHELGAGGGRRWRRRIIRAGLRVILDVGDDLAHLVVEITYHRLDVEDVLAVFAQIHRERASQGDDLLFQLGPELLLPLHLVHDPMHVLLETGRDSHRGLKLRCLQLLDTGWAFFSGLGIGVWTLPVTPFFLA